MTRTDDNWALAHSIQLTPCREGLKPGHEGVVIAEAHPTGWFISARFDPDLPAADIADFAHFVQVRTYLLLGQGPRLGLWEPDSQGVWRAHYAASRTASAVDLPITA
jgi:hypothetical protein